MMNEESEMFSNYCCPVKILKAINPDRNFLLCVKRRYEFEAGYGSIAFCWTVPMGTWRRTVLSEP